MKKSFYPKFAFDSIKKNKKLYIPYFLTSILWIMMYYILSSLGNSEYMKMLHGDKSIIIVLGFGSYVILIFSLILLFYTNSFLAKRRDGEYALYNILGMNKRNIGHILFWDTLITYVLSVALGLIAGAVMYKLAEIGLLKVMGREFNYSLSINMNSIIKTIIGYGAIYILILIKTLVKVKIVKPVEFLKNDNKGEKPPKANWILGIIGMVLLFAGYYIAITVNNPMAAFNKFFVAVILVIFGTFALFTAISIIILKMLQKNKNYYYKPNHFVSVSSMMYRMKRTGVGLASICILATMALVTVSFCTSLYYGSQDALNMRFPRDINLGFEQKNDGSTFEDKFKYIKPVVEEQARLLKIKVDEPFTTSFINIIVKKENKTLKVEPLKRNGNFENILIMKIITTDRYNKEAKDNIKLKDDQIIYYLSRGSLPKDSIEFNGKKLEVVKIVDKYWGRIMPESALLPTVTIVANKPDDLVKGITLKGEEEGFEKTTLKKTGLYSFNIKLDDNRDKAQVENILRENLSEKLINSDKFNGISTSSKTNGVNEYYAMIGGLLFIGIVLSGLFISAAVLIIYYKQIVEGYEDQKRFGIMQKVGMTDKEIKKTINSQLLSVFMLPLIVAGIHLSIAFPMLRIILYMFELYNTNVFIIATLISFIIFGIFYAIVYKLTSKAYYNIVRCK